MQQCKLLLAKSAAYYSTLSRLVYNANYAGEKGFKVSACLIQGGARLDGAEA